MCERIRMGDSWAIVCGRHQRLVRCIHCSAPAIVECDTCDQPLCGRCRTHVPPNQDYCRKHALALKQGALEL